MKYSECTQRTFSVGEAENTVTAASIWPRALSGFQLSLAAGGPTHKARAAVQVSSGEVMECLLDPDGPGL